MHSHGRFEGVVALDGGFLDWECGNRKRRVTAVVRFVKSRKVGAETVEVVLKTGPDLVDLRLEKREEDKETDKADG